MYGVNRCERLCVERGEFHTLTSTSPSNSPTAIQGVPILQRASSGSLAFFQVRFLIRTKEQRIPLYMYPCIPESLMHAVLLAAIGFAPIRSALYHAQPQLFLRRVQAQQTFTTSRSGRVACMETHTKATFFENGLPDEQTLRAALESAFTAIDRDDNAALDSEELARAGFDPELLLTWLDVNRDGKLSRDEFVESLMELYSADRASSMWNQKELQRLQELLSGGSVWGSRTVLRAINAPRFELISLVAVLVTALCYAVGTLPELGNESRFWLNNVEADFTVVFLVEYVLRWWSRSFSLKYLLKATSLIDLLSIAPTYLSVRRPGGGRG